MTTEFSVAYEITRTFTDEEMAHNPDPEEVMAIFVRQVEIALSTTNVVRGNTTFERLRSADMQGWVGTHSDGPGSAE